MGIKEFIDNYRQRSKELDEIYDDAVKQGYLESKGLAWDKEKYYRTLDEYCHMYGESVLSEVIIEEIEEVTGLGRSVMIKDLKKAYHRYQEQKKEENLQQNQINVQKELEMNDTLEKTILNEINQIPKTFQYNLVDANNTTVVGMCVHIVKKVIQEQRLLTSEAIEHVKGNLERKRQRNTTVQAYSKNLDENILYQLYKYADIINLYDCIHRHSGEMLQMNYNAYLDLVHMECKKSIENIEDEKWNNRAVFDMVRKYEKTSIADKQYDYVCVTLMVNVLLCAMNHVLYGNIESEGRKIPMYMLANQFSVEENITAMNTVVMNEVVKYLTYAY